MRLRCVVCKKLFTPFNEQSVFLCSKHRETIRAKIRTQKEKSKLYSEAEVRVREWMAKGE